MTTSDREVVAALGEAITRRVGEPRYRLWFDGKTKFTWEAEQLVVGVPNCFYQEWLQKKFGEAVQAAASDVLGQRLDVRFVIDPELFQAARQAQETEVKPAPREPASRRGDAASGTPAPPKRSAGPASPSTAARPTKRTRRWHRLGDFVVGTCNRLAHASALGVIEQPGQCASPLVVHGPVGTGKTHLLEGIYAGLRKKHPDWRVCFASAEDFTNRFVHAMHQGKLAAFRKHYREADAFLIDDLHFLARKRATQEEFLHTFDVLHAEGKQLVISCDCHPRLADEFTPELIDRLLGGAVWGLLPPDADTRLAILRAKSVRSETAIPDDVLQLLAQQLRGNVRELEGALHTVRHVSKVTGRPADCQLAQEALGELLRHALRIVQLPDIDRAVCQALHLETGALQSKQRAWSVSHPRMLAIYLARQHTAAAYSEIGSYFGGRNHSTAVAAEKKVRQLVQENGELLLGDRRLRVRDVIELVQRDLRR